MPLPAVDTGKRSGAYGLQESGVSPKAWQQRVVPRQEAKALASGPAAVDNTEARGPRHLADGLAAVDNAKGVSQHELFSHP